jgi:predicted transcriptional regulator
MTKIAEQLKKSGLAVSVNKRVWMYLKDHPDKSAKDIALALNVHQAQVYVAVNFMSSRKMLTSYIELEKRGVGRRSIKVYRAAGDRYELLPLIQKNQEVTVIVPEPAKQIEVNIDTLTVKEAKALYDKLKEIFG